MARLDSAIENVVSTYLDAEDKWNLSRTRSEECYRFVLNEQWNKEEIAAFLKRGSPPIVYNMILPRLNNLTGTEQMNRRSVQIRPYYSSQRELASILSGLFNHVWSIQNGEEELNMAFKDGLIMLVPGVIGIDIVPDETGFLDYQFQALNPMSVTFDPNHRRSDLSDCQYVIRESWMRPDEIMELYGEHDEIKKAAGDKRWWERISENLEGALNDMFGDASKSNMFHDRKRNLFKVLEMQTRITEERELFIDPQSGEYFQYSKKEAADAAAQGLQYMGGSHAKRIHLTTVCPYFNATLFDEHSWLDTDMYNVVPYYSINFNNIKSKNSSLVWAILDPQKNLNKREIQKTSYIDRSMIAPMAFSYEDRDTKELYDEEGTAPNFSMLVRNLKFPPHRIAPSQITSDVWNDIADSKDKMNEISGINDVARGQSEYSNESARLFQMKIERVGATINPYLRNLSETRRLIAQYFLATCRQVYSELDRLVTILDKQKNTETVVLNHQVGDTIRNQVSSFQGQVVLDEGEHSLTKLQENFEKKAALAAIMPPEFVNWAWVLKDSELPDVEEQIEYIDMILGLQADQAAAQQAMQEDQYAESVAAQRAQARQPQQDNKQRSKQ